MKNGNKDISSDFYFLARIVYKTAAISKKLEYGLPWYFI